ncbi:MAG: lytic transglycosylase domain-containing protein [Bryobacterales bacterium]|nr:lytic transglycosylase domain-containing protein [Bryobacterales bacterium]
MRPLFLLAVSLLLATLPLAAGEIVILKTGAEVFAERTERENGILRLHTATGVIELPEALVERAIRDDRPPAPTAATVALTPAPAPAASPDPKALIEAAADRYGLPSALLHSVARTESDYSPPAVSHKGAIGVMQLMPATAAQLNADPRDPAQNIDAGARHLRDLLLQYNGSTFKALAAYNAGAGAVQKYGGIPPYSETRNYVERVVSNYYRLSGEPPAKLD